jgi:hypothetical protein
LKRELEEFRIKRWKQAIIVLLLASLMTIMVGAVLMGRRPSRSVAESATVWTESPQAAKALKDERRPWTE